MKKPSRWPAASSARTVIIVARAGRQLAAAARAAGLTPLVADLFGDSDTREIAARWLGVAAGADFHFDPDSLRQAVAALRATAPQAPMGLVVGRLQNWKGAEVLCKALELVEDIHIEWVGRDTPWGNSGETASGYLEKNYPSVWGSKLIWRGPLEHAEAMEKISNAAFFVVPSIWDVFNLTAAEAMTRCVPIICSRKAGAEMLIDHGRSGFLFNPERPDELAVCLRKISALGIDEKRLLGQNGKDSVKHIMGEGDVLKILEESYLRILQIGGSAVTDAWIASFLSPGAPEATTQTDGLVHRALRKLRRILANV
jgi:hypothetical protein